MRHGDRLQRAAGRRRPAAGRRWRRTRASTPRPRPRTSRSRRSGRVAARRRRGSPQSWTSTRSSRPAAATRRRASCRLLGRDRDRGHPAAAGRGGDARPSAPARCRSRAGDDPAPVDQLGTSSRTCARCASARACRPARRRAGVGHRLVEEQREQLVREVVVARDVARGALGVLRCSAGMRGSYRAGAGAGAARHQPSRLAANGSSDGGQVVDRIPVTGHVRLAEPDLAVRAPAGRKKASRRMCSTGTPAAPCTRSAPSGRTESGRRGRRATARTKSAAGDRRAQAATRGRAACADRRLQVWCETTVTTCTPGRRAAGRGTRATPRAHSLTPCSWISDVTRAVISGWRTGSAASAAFVSGTPPPGERRGEHPLPALLQHHLRPTGARPAPAKVMR